MSPAQLWTVAAFVFCASWAGPCLALVSFSPSAVLNGNATTDNSPTTSNFPFNDARPSIAGDGSGNWVAVWDSTDTLGGTIDDGFDILVATSADNGLTWSAPVSIDASVGTSNPAIATDGNGTWVVVPQGAGLVSRSTDNGASWTPFTSVGLDLLAHPHVVTDGAGTWIIVGSSSDNIGGTIGTDRDIVTVRSVDNAVTWLAPAPASGAVDSSISDDDPRIATDGAGTWVVVWDRRSVVSTGTSFDDGLTWTAPVELDNLPESFFVGNGMSDITTDGTGTWVAVWGTHSGDEFDILSAVSVDDGATWTVPAAVSPTDDTQRNHQFARVATDGLGTWYAAWRLFEASFGGQLGKDSDMLLSRSIDGGFNWSPPAALVPDMASDSGGDVAAEWAYDGVGTWMVVWNSDDPGDGSLGDDFDVFAAVSTDDCPVAPLGGCLVPTSAKKSTFKAKDGKLGRDKALFKWSRGQETTLADFGDPTATSDYLWCAYDDVSTVPRLILEKDIPAAQSCKGRPCWEATTTGFRYRDPKREHGAVKSIILKAGVDGKAKIKMKATGALIGLPAIPLAQTPNVRVQLHNVETGRCWAATYSTNVRNGSDQFKARSD